jgi:hypothetical protein
MENYKGIFEVWIKNTEVILTECSEENMNTIKNDGHNTWSGTRSFLYGTINIVGGVLSYSGELFKTESQYRCADGWGLQRENLRGDDAWVYETKGKYWISDDRFKKVTIKKWFKPNEETNELLVHSYLKRKSDLVNGVSSNFRLNLLGGKNVKKVIL